MYVRLAFAVAAHIDPDILLIDEVLAVGDVAFQRKCLDKMEDVARGGRTVLFVSHNLSAVSRLCTTALLLRRGQLTAHGDVPGVLSRYMQDVGSAGGDQRRVRGELAIERISILGADADGAFHAFGACKVSVTIHAERTLDPAEVNFMIQDAQGRTCVHLRSDFDGCLPVLRPGRHLVEVEIDSLNLEPQIYFCWARVVCLKPRSFVDSERVPLEVHAEWPVHQGSQSVVAVQRRWSWREDS